MSKYPTYPTFEGELLSSIQPHSSQSTKLETDVMGCQAILFEWAESYDSKVCALTPASLPKNNIESGLGASPQVHRPHPEGQY